MANNAFNMPMFFSLQFSYGLLITRKIIIAHHNKLVTSNGLYLLGGESAV